MQALGEDPEKGPTPAQREVLQLFTKLSRKLDSLSNFHYTPKPPLPELEVRKSVAAINMEEVSSHVTLCMAISRVSRFLN